MQLLVIWTSPEVGMLHAVEMLMLGPQPKLLQADMDNSYTFEDVFTKFVTAKDNPSFPKELKADIFCS